MMRKNFTISIHGDSEGYVTFECPYCGYRFKLNAKEYQSATDPVVELFCPHCGLVKEKNKFLSRNAIEQAKILACKNMAEEINKKIQRSAKYSKGMIKMNLKSLKEVPIKELKDQDILETKLTCECCGHSVKVPYCNGAAKVFCPYCGVDI